MVILAWILLTIVDGRSNSVTRGRSSYRSSEGSLVDHCEGNLCEFCCNESNGDCLTEEQCEDNISQVYIVVGILCAVLILTSLVFICARYGIWKTIK